MLHSTFVGNYLLSASQTTSGFPSWGSIINKACSLQRCLTSHILSVLTCLVCVNSNQPSVSSNNPHLNSRYFPVVKYSILNFSFTSGNGASFAVILPVTLGRAQASPEPDFDLEDRIRSSRLNSIFKIDIDIDETLLTGKIMVL